MSRRVLPVANVKIKTVSFTDKEDKELEVAGNLVEHFGEGCTI